MNANKNKLGLLALFLILTLTSCALPAAGPDTPADQKTGTTTGILEIALTDDPPDLNVEKVVVTISRVRVHLAAAEEEGTETPEEEEEGENEGKGWFTVVEAPQTFDLVALQDTEALLGSAALEPGKYTQIRLDIDQATATIDGVEQELKIPSGTIKLTHAFSIEAGQTTKLTLDFDAQKSVHAAGEKYMMKPTIRIIAEGPLTEGENE